MKILRNDGTRWESIGQGVTTSDGFRIQTFVQIDENGLDITDDDGFPITHSFFLGRVNES